MLNREKDGMKRTLERNVSDILVSNDSVVSLASVYRERLQKRCKKQHGLKNADIEVVYRVKDEVMIVSFSGKDIRKLNKITKQERYKDRVEIMQTVAEAELVRLFPQAVCVDKAFQKDGSGEIVYRIALKISE